MTAKFIKFIEDDGWSICCESPLEIEHKDGHSATGLAASYVLSSLDEEYCAYINDSNSTQNINIQKVLEGNRYSDYAHGNIKYTKYKIIVPTEDDKGEIIKAFDHIHYSNIDTDLIAVNQLSHEYLEDYNIIVDEKIYNNISG